MEGISTFGVSGKTFQLRRTDGVVKYEPFWTLTTLLRAAVVLLHIYISHRWTNVTKCRSHPMIVGARRMI